MAVVVMCRGASAALRHVEPVIVLEQLGNTLFETALQLVVKDRSANASTEAGQQKAMTDFYMTYNLIIRFVPILPSLLLAKLSDRGWRRAPVVVPLSGYLLSRLLLLLVVLGRLPLEVMFAAAALFGLTGGFSAFWPGVMTLVSFRSSPAERSKVMMRVELLYGAAGLVGSLVSGHLFQLYTSNLGNGTILLILSIVLHLLSLCLAAFLLQVKYVSHKEPAENRSPLSPTSHNAPVDEGPAGINKLNVALLFAAAFLYDFAVGGAISLLGSFVLKTPLSWTAEQVGYGNAAGCGIFFTSFLGVVVFRRFASEETIILIGMLSFASGIYFMTFVTTTSMFYIARSLNLFALIPMPTIRSLLSQHVPASSCGTALTFLQMTLKIAGIVYIPVFTSVYQKSLEWLPGMVFLFSSIITVFAMIPISILGCRTARAKHYKSIQEDPESLNQ